MAQVTEMTFVFVHGAVKVHGMIKHVCDCFEKKELHAVAMMSVKTGNIFWLP